MHDQLKMSWVTLDRFCQEESAKDDSLRRKLEADHRPLRSSASTLAPVAMRPPSGEVGEHGQVEGDREGFRHFEDVSLPQGDRFAVAAVLP